ncbi:hypothetical protein BGW39_007634 [Mortierella sp. 14UC]|nr:hypothetical protein BGW39_007634 [Mortierella sp. 14UC]
MRIGALFAALLAVGASTVAAAPKHAQPTVSLNAHSNTTLSGTEHTVPTKAEIEEEKFLRARLPKYDPKAAAEFAEYFQNIVYGKNQTARNNALRRPQAGVRAAAAYNGLPVPHCVGIAWNPTRTQIFKNREKCDISGWTTLWVFTALADFDKYMARDPMCVGKAGNPSRSMFFSGRTTCDISGWDTDFHFYETGRGGPAGAETKHESTEMWQKYDPHRMMIYPYYQGNKHDWQWAYSFRYVNRWRDATPGELEAIREHMVEHGELRKRNWDHDEIENDAERDAVNALIAEWNYAQIDFTDNRVIYGRNLPNFRAAAQLGDFGHLLNLAQIEINQHWFSSVTTIFIRVNNRILASMTITRNLHFGVDTIQQALRLSARNNGPQALESRGLLSRIFASVGPSGSARMMGYEPTWSLYGKLN